MNLLEAIQNCGENWFRPVSHRYPGEAFSKSHNTIVIEQVDGKHHAHMTYISSTLLGPWEIVTPEQVMKERK